MANIVKRSLLWVAGGAMLAGLTWGIQSGTIAQAQNEDDPGKAIRCANRLSISLLGNAAQGELLSSADPQASVDRLLEDPIFVERFSRYINSKMNEAPGAVAIEDSAYYLMKHVLQNKLPWKDFFTGTFDLTATGQGAAATVNVVQNPNGIGYFRNRAWMERYAGNELTGLRLNAAYRIPHNIVGLELLATTNAPGADVSASGRAAPACKGCHFEGWYALDKTSAILGRVQRSGPNNATVTFLPSDGTPKEVLGGQMLKDDKDLINALVSSEQHLVHSCRLAFGYLYGRHENACEGEVFDACVDALKATGKIQAGLGAIAKDESFCQ
jgi:hypothetical protein